MNDARKGLGFIYSVWKGSRQLTDGDSDLQQHPHVVAVAELPLRTGPVQVQHPLGQRQGQLGGRTGEARGLKKAR